MRALTKLHYTVLHTGLLLWPANLCCDWSSGAIDNVVRWSDYRNIDSLALVLAFVYLFCFCFNFGS